MQIHGKVHWKTTPFEDSSFWEISFTSHHTLASFAIIVSLERTVVVARYTSGAGAAAAAVIRLEAVAVGHSRRCEEKN
jgi:hypothetical protein